MVVASEFPPKIFFFRCSDNTDRTAEIADQRDALVDDEAYEVNFFMKENFQVTPPPSSFTFIFFYFKA